MKKRLLTLLLAGTMVFSALVMSGCGSGGDVDYAVDYGYDKVMQDAIDAYGKYVNTGSIFPYMGKMNDEESDTYNKIDTALKDYTYIAVPDMIKNGLDGWDEYVEKVNTYDVETACDIYQKYVDEANGK